MTLSEMVYVRPNLDQYLNTYRERIEAFQTAANPETHIDILRDLNALRSDFDSVHTLCHIRHSQDTQNVFYKEEQDFFDQNDAAVMDVDKLFYEAILASPWLSQVKAAFGDHFVHIATLGVQTFDASVADEVTQESQLSTEYTAQISSAQIPFEGQMLTLSQLGKHLSSTDRAVRKAANEAKYGFFAQTETSFDTIYDDMVRVRTTMAQKLGYENFVDLAYKRLNRTDYDALKVRDFREQVKRTLVPLATKLREEQRDRLGVSTLLYYDEALEFPSGNAEPKGDPAWILEQGKRMYHELSPETGAFIDFMMENELLDVLSRKGKRVGGFCTVIPSQKYPFVFANFNGTLNDVRVLTHEAGHAFMAYCYPEPAVLEYQFPTLEAAEIHSFGMEFLTWNWMDLFFGDDAESFKFQHLTSAITSIPYMVAVDEFQHVVYENPSLSPTDRKMAWREIERTYMPHRQYDDNDFLERGGYWHQQSHIFRTPFYYIDYALARICALQLWTKSQTDFAQTWNDYLNLCKLGGSKPFLELVKAANIVSPFDSGCIEGVVKGVESWLQTS